MAFCHIGVAIGDQPFDDCDDLWDRLGGARLMGWLKNVERGNIGLELPGGAPGQVADRHALLLGPRIDLVIDVGDVAHIGDVLGAIEMAQQPEQHVENDDGPGIADMGKVIDRRAADIDAHSLRIDRLEDVLGSGQGIVKSQRHKVLGACRPGGSLRLELKKSGRQPAFVR